MNQQSKQATEQRPAITLYEPPPDQQADSLGALNAHGLAGLRAIILTVIDDGDPKRKDGHGRFCNRWQLDDPNEEIANEQRLRFCDAIQQAIIDRAARPQQGKSNEHSESI